MTQTLDPQINDTQLSMEYHWTNTDLSSFFDNGACDSELAPETALDPRVQRFDPLLLTGQEAQETPAEDVQPTRETSPRLINGNASTPDPTCSTVPQTLKPLVQASPGTDSMRSEGASKPLNESEQVVEV
jgi:hypothetical protein